MTRLWFRPLKPIILALFLAAILGCGSGTQEQASEPRATTPLHLAAQNGQLDSVGKLLSEGADPNARDEEGKTPLHWSAANGHGQTSSTLIEGGADPNLLDDSGMTPVDYARANQHVGTAEIIAKAQIGSAGAPGRSINPGAAYRDLPAFERAIGADGVLIRSENVWLFAPKSREDAAKLVHSYLVKAYDELHDIVGIDTEYAIAVYNFSKGHQDAFGGTSNCVIFYDDTNLDLEAHEEWTLHRVPHVSGYIEEMAHNFVSKTGVQFGWEMVGWTIGILASTAVADNPEFERNLIDTRRNQTDTFNRYGANGFVLPDDVPPNQVDRIHAYLLWQCERDYGPRFWPDFFVQVNKNAARFAAADGRDARYRLSIECFDALPGVHLSDRLQENGISLTTDVKSLDPTGPTWNRRLK